MKKKEKKGTKNLEVGEGTLNLFFYPHSHFRGKRGHAGIINANFNRSPHASHALFFINHLRWADFSLSNNYAASKSSFFIVLDKTR